MNTPLEIFLCETIGIKGNDSAQIALIPSQPAWTVLNKKAVELLRSCCSNNGHRPRNGPYQAIDLTPFHLDKMVMHLRSQEKLAFSVCEAQVEGFFNSLPVAHTPLSKRTRERAPSQLKELWFHLTDSCNLRCSHCLFSGDLGKGRSLGREIVLDLVKKASDLGAKLICFTGGEPLVYPGFLQLAQKIIKDFPVNIAVLTNGTLLREHEEALRHIPYQRIHFQISLDGPPQIHDAIRGRNAFKKTMQGIETLKGLGMPFSIAYSINHLTISNLPEFIDLLVKNKIKNLHLMWHFLRGNGERIDRIHEDHVDQVMVSIERATQMGITVDNLQAVESQVFSPVGTAFDTGNGGWESLTVGPDGFIYATPANVDVHWLKAGHIKEGLKEVWLNSTLLKRLRSITWENIPGIKDDPWHPILGSGDLDHSIIGWDDKREDFVLTPDPYYPVQKRLAIMAIEQELPGNGAPQNSPQVLLRMGDVMTQCPSSSDINFTHSNCLLSISSPQSQQLIREFYADRARRPDESIRNPVTIQDHALDFIPQKALVRMYGCGSPVSDAGLNPGESLLDLGCGTGVECFLASKLVGPQGRVYGLDMLTEMLNIANEAKGDVRRALGYDNITFIRGDMESIPLPDESVDVVVSNCVINLTRNKRRVLSEIFRLLRPGGRLVISDVVTDSEPALDIRGDHGLSGECIGGAMVQPYLFCVLQSLGFTHAAILKRFPYREVKGHPFHSLTFRAYKPQKSPKKTHMLYGGPGHALVFENNTLLKGLAKEVYIHPASAPLEGYGLFLMDASGVLTNQSASPTCSCCVTQTDQPKTLIEINRASQCDCQTDLILTQKTPVHTTGCLICGAPIEYYSDAKYLTCSICQREYISSSACENGHFVCDACHITDPMEVIREICLSSRETDMLQLMQEIRGHRRFPMHGPEHHAMVPAIILTSYRNLGGDIEQKDIILALERGGKIPGGACGYMGACGAAIGVGVAFSIMFNSSPVNATKRRDCQTIVKQVLERITDFEAARCCQRESYIALKTAEGISKTLLPVPLRAETRIVCRQYNKNKECIGKGCPLNPASVA